MADGKPGRGSDQFPLRLPDGMRDRLKAAAERNKRSMNAEIVDRLDRSFYEPTEDNFLEMLATSKFIEPLPQGLAARLQASAEESQRSVKDEVIYRLEDSFESSEGYAALAELALESLKQSAEDSRREVEEYRVMVGTITMMRYTIDRLRDILSEESIPEDVARLLALLAPRKVRGEADISGVLESLYEAMENRDRIAAEQEATSRDRLSGAERKLRLLKIIEDHSQGEEK